MFFHVVVNLALATSYVSAEPIPVVHDRLIRRCENHTGDPHPPYGYSYSQIGPHSSIPTVLSTGIESSSSPNNTTANAVNATAPVTSASTTLPSSVSFSASSNGIDNQTTHYSSGGTVIVTSTVFAASALNSTTLIGPTTTWFFTSSTSSGASSTSEGNGTAFISTTVTESTDSLPSPSTSNLAGNTSTVLASAGDISLSVSSSTVANISTSAILTPASSIGNNTSAWPTVTGVNSNSSLPAVNSTSSSCSDFSYGCSPPYTNSSLGSSSPGSTTAGPVETSNISTPAASTKLNFTTAGPTIITVFITAPGSSETSTANGTWTTSNAANISQISWSYQNFTLNSVPVPTAPAITNISAVTGLSSTDLSPVSGSGASISFSVSASANATSLNQGWAEWEGPTTSNKPGSVPTTMLTSFTTSNVTSVPTGSPNATTSTASLAEIEAEVEQLAGDSVGLIEKLNALLAGVGGKKRHVKHAV